MAWSLKKVQSTSKKIYPRILGFFFFIMETKEKLLEQLNALRLFPNNKQVRELRKQIKGKLSKKQKPKEKKKPNKSRSDKLRKYHRYIKLVRNSFPELSHAEIRKQFSKRRNGVDVKIPDVIWRNPSP